jgi:hypothetical protein
MRGAPERLGSTHDGSELVCDDRSDGPPVEQATHLHRHCRSPMVGSGSCGSRRDLTSSLRRRAEGRSS